MLISRKEGGIGDSTTLYGGGVRDFVTVFCSSRATQRRSPEGFDGAVYSVRGTGIVTSPDVDDPSRRVWKWKD